MTYKFLAGGAPPLVTFTPVVYSGQEASATTSSKASSGDEALEKLQNHADKYFTKLMDNMDVLDNDNVALKTLWLQIENYIKMYEKNGLPVNTAEIRLMYGEVISKAKMAKVHKKDYDDARTYLLNNGGINEVVTTSNGLLFTYNKETNDYKYMRPEEWTPDSGYRPLTNSDLLYLRNKDASMDFNSDIFRLLELGIGVKTIQDYINNMTGNIGATEITKQGYSATLAGQITLGIQLLQEAASKGLIKDGSEFSIEGLYKNKILNKELAQLALLALLYVYTMLPENMKTILKMKTSDHTDEGALKVVMSFIGSKLSPKYEFDTTYLSDLNPDGTKKSEKDKDELNPVLAWVNDIGAKVDLKINAGTSDGITVTANVLPAMSKEGSVLGVTTLQNLASGSGLAGVLDFSKVYVGNNRVQQEGLLNVVVNANLVYKAYLPVVVEKDGTYRPATEKLALMEKVREEIKRTNAKSELLVNAIYEKHGLPRYFDLNGGVDERYYKPFAVLNATAYNKAFAENADLEGINYTQVEDKNEIDNAWSILKGKDSKEKFDDGWFGSDKMVKSLAYIPLISTNPVLASYSGNSPVTATQNANYETRYLLQQRLQGRTLAGTLQQ